MAERKKPLRDPIPPLFESLADYHQTVDEASDELRAAGVDVAGFAARLKQRLAKQAEDVRLAWLVNAREQIRIEEEGSPVETYKDLDRAALIAAFAARQANTGQAHAYHHKLESLTDDDLRTLLTDLDDLDESKKPA